MPHYLTWEVDVGWKVDSCPHERRCVTCWWRSKHLITTPARRVTAFRTSPRLGSCLPGEPLRRTLSRPRLLLPSALAIFEALLGRERLRCQVSQPGRYLEALVRLWGGLDRLVAAMRRTPAVYMLEAFCQDETQSDTGIFLRSLERRFLTFEDLRVATKIAADDLRDMVDDFTSRGILRRGLILKCRECMYDNWYPADDVGHSFRCPRCSEMTPLTRAAWRLPPEEPWWYYQLVEVAFQAVKNSARATALALGALKEKSRSFIYAPELELRNEANEVVSQTTTCAAM